MPNPLGGFEPLTLIAFTLPLLLLFLASFIDLYRRDDLSILKKAIWATFIFFTVYVGVAIYFIVRPTRLPEGKRYRKTVNHSAALITSLEDLRDRHNAGEIDDAGYLGQKRTLLGLDAPAAK